MKKIDAYILKRFLGTFFYSIFLIIIIVIIFDVSEKIEDFINKHAPLNAIVFDYYLNFTPYFINLFSPLFVFISVIFFTSKMASNTEIVAILSSGISFKRLLFPYFLAALILCSLSLYLNNFVIPIANKKRMAFEEKYVRNTFYNSDLNIHKQIDPGTFIYLEHYNNQQQMGYKFSLEKIVNGKLTYKLMAENVEWDSLHKSWHINHYFIRKIDGLNEVLTGGARFDTILNFSADDFGRKLANIETLDYFELKNYISTEKMKGSDNVQLYEIERYKRIAFPFATFILTLIGVSLASRKVRGGIGYHIGLGLLISFSFILFMQVSTTFAASGLASPLISVWIPNFIFGLLALYMLKRALK